MFPTVPVQHRMARCFSINGCCKLEYAFKFSNLVPPFAVNGAVNVEHLR